MKQIEIKQRSEKTTLSQIGSNVKIVIQDLGETTIDKEALLEAIELLEDHWDESKYKTTVEVIDTLNPNRPPDISEIY